jgi:hypothetical protein
MTVNALVVINFVILLAGMAAVATGIYAISLTGTIGYTLAPLVGHPYWLFALGLLIVTVSGLGLYTTGTSYGTGHHGMLRLYFVALTGLLLVQLVMSTLVLARQADVDYLLNDAWDRAFQTDHPKIEKVERAFSCCGFSSVRDRPVPRDCLDNERFGFVVSCRDRLAGPLRTAVGAVGWAGMGVAALIGLALVVAVAAYGEQVWGEGGSGEGGYEREAARMAEARQLLREGGLAAHQQR